MKNQNQGTWESLGGPGMLHHSVTLLVEFSMEYSACWWNELCFWVR